MGVTHPLAAGEAVLAASLMTPIQWLGILLLLAGILGFAWYVLTDGTDPELLEEPPTMNTRNDQ